VDESADVGTYSTIAVDSGGATPLPHIAYRDFSNDDLKYAYATGPDFYDLEWHTETVDTTGNVGRYASIALDGDGTPHITYYDEDNYDLKHAYRPGQEWLTETVDSDGDVGRWSSLAIDEEGTLHVAYYDASNGTVKYATLVTPP
jgi:hypothetical protein